MAEIGLEGEGGLALVIDIADTALGGFEQRVGNGFAITVHAYGVRLHYGRLPEDVDHKSRELIAFAVDEAVDVVVLRSGGEAKAPAEVEGLVEATRPEGVVDGLVLKGEDAHRDGSDLVVADGDELSVGIDDAYLFAFVEFDVAGERAV